jgi:hypothetical protein
VRASKRATHPAEIGHRVDVGPTSRHVLQQRHHGAGHGDVQRTVGQRHRSSAAEPTLGRTSSHPQARAGTGPLLSVGELSHVPPTVDRPHQPHRRVPATRERHHRQGPALPPGQNPQQIRGIHNRGRCQKPDDSETCGRQNRLGLTSDSHPGPAREARGGTRRRCAACTCCRRARRPNSYACHWPSWSPSSTRPNSTATPQAGHPRHRRPTSPALRKVG